jgi:hypothetical protein
MLHNSIETRKIARAGIIAFVVLWNCASLASPCPFCAGVLPSFRDEYHDLSEFHVAICLKCQEQKNEPGLFSAELRVVEPLKSITRITKNTSISMVTFDPLAAHQLFLVKGYGEKDQFQWVAPTTILPNEIDYVREATRLAKNETPMLARLQFFFEHRDSPSTLIREDCFNELGKTSIEDLQWLKPLLDPNKLKESLRSDQHSTDRKRLDWVLLGICGQASDAAIFDELLDRYYKKKQATTEIGTLIRQSIGLDAAISTYITLLGEKGLERIEKDFISNPQCDFSDSFSAILALRVQGNDIQKISRTRIAQSLTLVLQRHDMADLVVPDLARWEQWNYCDTLIQIYQKSEKDDLRLRIPIINYLRVCPHPQAKEMLESIRLQEPINYRRALTLFPQLEIPKNSQPSEGSLLVK